MRTYARAIAGSWPAALLVIFWAILAFTLGDR